MIEYTAEDYREMLALLRSPAWRMIQQKIEPQLIKMKGAAQGSSDPFMSGKLNGAVFGWEACLEEIACVAEPPPDDVPPVDEFPDEGRVDDDPQTKENKT